MLNISNMVNSQQQQQQHHWNMCSMYQCRECSNSPTTSHSHGWTLGRYLNFPGMSACAAFGFRILNRFAIHYRTIIIIIMDLNMLLYRYAKCKLTPSGDKHVQMCVVPVCGIAFELIFPTSIAMPPVPNLPRMVQWSSFSQDNNLEFEC